jgi:hypothetical protein
MSPVVVSGASGCALSDIRTELKSRTSSELTSARVDAAINDAYFEINERASGRGSKRPPREPLR